jgi:hypothetical protein
VLKPQGTGIPRANRILLLIFASGAASCTRKAPSDARNLYADAWLKVKRGDLTGANADVDAFGVSASAANVEWTSRFHVLKAEILRRQGKFNESLALLEAPLPEELTPRRIA